MMWGYDHMNGWSWAFMGVGMVVFWAVIITALVLLVRYLTDDKRSSRTDADPSASEILARRFARGEISEQEFLDRSKRVKH